MSLPEPPPVPSPDVAARMRRGLDRHLQRSIVQLAATRGLVPAERRDELLALVDAGAAAAGLLSSRAGVSPELLASLLRELDEAPGPASRYELTEKIGEGGMAVVYHGIDRQLGRPVALKILKESAQGSDQVRERFRREASIIARLSHPNIVSLHDVQEENGQMRLVMEFVPGGSLERPIKGRPADLGPLLAILEKTARAVHHAHGLGIVHRDLKPGNILLTPEQEPKVSDFGLAHLMDADEAITRSGATLGTPAYMAPEQVQGRSRDIGARTDVYALGVMLYELLAGRRPHEGDSSAEIFRRKLEEEPVPPRRFNPAAPRDLETIALKAIESDPARRYASAADFADDLRRYRSDEPILARPVTTWDRIWRRTLRHRLVLLPVASALLVGAAVAFKIWTRTEQRIQEESAGASRRRTEVTRLLEEARGVIERVDAASYDPAADIPEALSGLGPAIARLREAVAMEPALPLGHHLLARALELQGDEAGAEGAWREAIRLDTTFSPARFHLGRLLLVRAFLLHSGKLLTGEAVAQGQALKEASAQIDRALESGFGADLQLQRSVAKAMLAYAKEDPAEVRRIAEAALAPNPRRRGTEELYWLLGHASEGAEKTRAYETALAIRPHFALAQIGLSNDLSRRGDIGAAIAWLDKAARIAPRREQILINRGFLRTQRGELAEALADLDRAVALNAASPMAWYFRSRAKYAMRNAAGAEEDATRVVALLRDYPLAYDLRAKARMARGDLDGAIADLGEALRIVPDHPQFLANRGLVRFEKKDWDAAAADLDKAIRGEPGNRGAWVTRSQVRRAKGDAAGAIEDADQVVALSPDWADGYFLRALARQEAKDRAGAAIDIRMALERAPAGWPYQGQGEALLKQLTAEY